LCFQRIPKKDDEINLSFGNLCPNLQISPKWTALRLTYQWGKVNISH
jgi:hypothetical protein